MTDTAQSALSTQAAIPSLLATPPWQRDDAVRVPKSRWSIDAKASIHVPHRTPTMPVFLQDKPLQAPVTNEGVELPAKAVEHLVIMYSYDSPGIPEVVRRLDPASMTAFLLDVLDAWVRTNMPSDQRWALDVQKVHGGAEAIAKLAPWIPLLPQLGNIVKAEAAVETIAAIGGPAAITALRQIADETSSKRLREVVDYKFWNIARSQGLSADQLADLAIPTAGVGDDIVLDFGSRSFTVGFDHELKPLLRGADGKIRKTFPRAAAADDPDMVADAKERFAKLRKDVRKIAKTELGRLEEAMVRQRRWSQEEFQTVMVEHPLMLHLARRLVWATTDRHGTIDRTFRITEDSSMADANDDPIELEEGRTVLLTHPLLLDDAVLAGWVGLLEDYELLQPFEQLGRSCYEMTEDEIASTSFHRFCDGREHEVFSLLALEKRGWARGDRSEAHAENLRKHVGRWVEIAVDPGIYIPRPPDSEPSTIVSVRLDNNDEFRMLQPIARSELVRDLLHAFGEPNEPLPEPVPAPQLAAVSPPPASNTLPPSAVAPPLPPSMPRAPAAMPPPPIPDTDDQSEAPKRSVLSRIFGRR